MKRSLSFLFCCLVVLPTFVFGQDAPFLGLWKVDAPFPTKSELKFPEGVKHYVVQDGNDDPEYEFMHETAVGFWNDELVFGWYNNPKQELQGKTIQRARRSCDFGETWTSPERVMDQGFEKGLMYVGLQFWTVGGEQFLLSNQENGAEKPVDCLLAKYDRDAKEWRMLGAVAPRFLAMQAPILMENGSYVVSGSYAVNPGQTFASTPAVFVSQGKDVAKPWKLSRLDPNEKVNVFAETAVVVDGANLLAVARREESPFPNFYESRDFGKTWRSIENKTFPAVCSKFAAGKFSDGTRYIVFNLPDFERDAQGKIKTDSIRWQSRDSLVIAIAKPNEDAFSQIYKVSDPTTSTRLTTSHYPCVVEHNGWIYVSYTATIRDKSLRVGALTKFPLDSLK